MKSITYPTSYKHFLRELRDARKQTGLTQEQLAEALGQRQTYVSKCECGDRRLDVVELRAWVIALGGDLSAFVTALDDRISRHERPTLGRESKNELMDEPKATSRKRRTSVSLAPE